MKAFKEFLAAKAKEGKSSIEPKAAKAKKEMLDHLSGLMKDHMSSGLKKVTVASDSTEGLKKGLEKAEEILPESEKMSEESEEMDSNEEMSEDESEDEEMSLEEIDELIRHLQEKKSKLS